MPTSSRIGGCTFPEDPTRTCASVLPIWSVAVDPRVLTVCAVKPSDAGVQLFDHRSSDVRMVRGPHCEHLVIDRGAGPVRLDVNKGSVIAGPVTLRFDLPDDDRLDDRIAAIRTFRAMAPTGRLHRRLADRLITLHAVDARDGGTSLRELADILLGPGDWPGDGEHRKSYVRRLLAAGSRMIASGPRAILNGN